MAPKFAMPSHCKFSVNTCFEKFYADISEAGKCRLCDQVSNPSTLLSHFLAHHWNTSDIIKIRDFFVLKCRCSLDSVHVSKFCKSIIGNDNTATKFDHYHCLFCPELTAFTTGESLALHCSLRHSVSACCISLESGKVAYCVSVGDEALDDVGQLLLPNCPQVHRNGGKKCSKMTKCLRNVRLVSSSASAVPSSHASNISELGDSNDDSSNASSSLSVSEKRKLDKSDSSCVSRKRKLANSLSSDFMNGGNKVKMSDKGYKGDKSPVLVCLDDEDDEHKDNNQRLRNDDQQPQDISKLSDQEQHLLGLYRKRQLNQTSVDKHQPSRSSLSSSPSSLVCSEYNEQQRLKQSSKNIKKRSDDFSDIKDRIIYYNGRRMTVGFITLKYASIVDKKILRNFQLKSKKTDNKLMIMKPRVTLRDAMQSPYSRNVARNCVNNDQLNRQMTNAFMNDTGANVNDTFDKIVNKSNEIIHLSSNEDEMESFSSSGSGRNIFSTSQTSLSPASTKSRSLSADMIVNISGIPSSTQDCNSLEQTPSFNAENVMTPLSPSADKEQTSQPPSSPNGEEIIQCTSSPTSPNGGSGGSGGGGGGLFRIKPLCSLLDPTTNFVSSSPNKIFLSALDKITKNDLNLSVASSSAFDGGNNSSDVITTQFTNKKIMSKSIVGNYVPRQKATKVPIGRSNEQPLPHHGTTLATPTSGQHSVMLPSRLHSRPGPLSSRPNYTLSSQPLSSTTSSCTSSSIQQLQPPQSSTLNSNLPRLSTDSANTSLLPRFISINVDYNNVNNNQTVSVAQKQDTNVPLLTTSGGGGGGGGGGGTVAGSRAYGVKVPKDFLCTHIEQIYSMRLDNERGTKPVRYFMFSGLHSIVATLSNAGKLSGGGTIACKRSSKQKNRQNQQQNHQHQQQNQQHPHAQPQQHQPQQHPHPQPQQQALCIRFDTYTRTKLQNVCPLVFSIGERVWHLLLHQDTATHTAKAGLLFTWLVATTTEACLLSRPGKSSLTQPNLSYNNSFCINKKESIYNNDNLYIENIAYK